MHRRLGRQGSLLLCVAGLLLLARPALADELWVAPTIQSDTGGIGVAQNIFWPVTAGGAVRLAFAVPSDLLTLHAAKLVVIPRVSGASEVRVTVCSGQNTESTEPASACRDETRVSFTGVANQLTEVDLAAVVSPHVAFPGTGYVTVFAVTAPTVATDRVLGMRVVYDGAASIQPGRCDAGQVVVGFDAAGPECDYPRYAP